MKKIENIKDIMFLRIFLIFPITQGVIKLENNVIVKFTVLGIIRDWFPFGVTINLRANISSKLQLNFFLALIRFGTCRIIAKFKKFPKC